MRSIILALTVALAAPSSAATLEDIIKCKGITDHAVRLDCYDSAVDASSENVEAHNSGAISWKDFRLDYQSLKGEVITTSGLLLLFGDGGMLYDVDMGITAFFVEIKRLPRDQRRAILERCSSPCAVDITGRAADVLMNPGIIATNVSLR